MNYYLDEDTEHFMSDAQVIVNVHPSFGEWVDASEITPEMVKGKLVWIAAQVNRVRRAIAAAERTALAARHAHDDAVVAALAEATRRGATSQADAERTAARITRETKKARESAELEVRILRDELEALYRSQMPATQSINRIAMAEWEADWRAAGAQP